MVLIPVGIGFGYFLLKLQGGGKEPEVIEKN
jgi:hypothetical protein